MTRVSGIRVFAGGVIALLLLSSSPAFAQTAAPGTRIPVTNKQVVSANPFLLMAEYVNVEFERKHTDTRTFGVSASSFGFHGADYRNFQTFYRYYPQGASLTGVYLGGRAGLHRVSVDKADAAGNAFGLGLEVGYGWLFGAKRNFAVSIGAGATRLWGEDGGSAIIPTLRIVNVGWSF